MNKFKLTVLGSGGAFATMEQGNSAFLVEYKDRRILIDCGMTVPYVLRDEMGIPLQAITDIILTHCHSDHSGGVEMMMHACRWLPPGAGYPSIHAWLSVHDTLRDVLQPLSWEANGDYHTPHTMHYKRWVHTLEDEGRRLCDLPIFFRRVKHVGELPATAVRLGPLFVSGDTKTPVEIPEGVSLIFHEAEFGFETGVHCPVAALVEHCQADSLRGKEIWAYHCPPDAVAPGPLAGVLRKGQVFELEIP